MSRNRRRERERGHRKLQIVGSIRRLLLHGEHLKSRSQIHRPCCFNVRICFCASSKRYSSFDLLTPSFLPSVFEPRLATSPSVLSLIQWLFLCEPVILSDNCRRTLHINQSLQIITSISMYPQTPITSLSWSPLMTIWALCRSPVLTTKCYPAVYSCEKQAVCRDAKIMKLWTKAALISFNFKKLLPHETLICQSSPV